MNLITNDSVPDELTISVFTRLYYNYYRTTDPTRMEFKAMSRNVSTREEIKRRSLRNVLLLIILVHGLIYKTLRNILMKWLLLLLDVKSNLSVVLQSCESIKLQAYYDRV